MEEADGGDAGAERAEGADTGDSGDARDVSDSDDDEEIFDITLAATHSYMGSSLQPVRGHNVLEPGWEGRVPVRAHYSVVFPGETVPMLFNDAHDAAMLTQAINHNKLFGLLCPEDQGEALAGYGVLCEVFEANDVPASGAQPSPSLKFKARAYYRFRFLDAPDTSMYSEIYASVRMADVVVLPEVVGTTPLQRARLASLDSLRRGRTPMDRRLRNMDAAVTAWPLFVYDIFDYHRMHKTIKKFFHTLGFFDTLPDDPVSLSFWVARNLTLSTRDRLALFVVDDALLRLQMEVRDITRKSVLCCSACATEIARREHVVIMSVDGLHASYTNLGGYVHDIVTLSRVFNTALTGGPSSEFSWFPGYTWTIAVCASCMAHVGWRFDAERRNLRPRHFYGLCSNYVAPYDDETAQLGPLVPPRPRLARPRPRAAGAPPHRAL